MGQGEGGKDRGVEEKGDLRLANATNTIKREIEEE